MNIIALSISLIYLAETERGLVPYDSKGKLQITKSFVRDVNRVSGKKYDIIDRLDFGKSCEMATIWLSYYQPLAEKATGRKLNEYDLAVMYRTGLVGFLRGDGAAYRKMIHGKLARLNPNDAIFVALQKARQG